MHYLVTPYTSGLDPESDIFDSTLQRRFEQACILVGALQKNGLHVYSPIVHWHSVAARVGLPRGSSFWFTINCEEIDRCGQLLVPELPGLQESIGCQGEIRYARMNSIPMTTLPTIKVEELLHEEGWQLVV